MLKIIGILAISLISCFCMDLDPPRIRTAVCRHYKTKEDCLTPWIIGPRSSGSWCQWTTNFGFPFCEWSPESIEIHLCRPKSGSNCKGPYCYLNEWGSCRSAPLSCLSRVTQGSCEKSKAYNNTYCHWYNTGATHDNLGFSLCGVK